MTLSLPALGADRPHDASVAAAAASKGAVPAREAVQSAETTARADAAAQAKAMRKELEQALVEMNRQMQANGRDLAFSMDEKADRMVIRVTNSVTGEVVRQIPDETVLRIARSIEDFKGLLHDQST